MFTNDPDTFEELGTLSGFDFDSLSITLQGEVGDYEYKLGYNPDRDRIRSAYARFRPVEPLRLTLGRFKAPLLRSRLVRTTRLLFPNRTVLAVQSGPRDLGAKAELDLGEHVRWYAAVQNGEDDLGDDHQLTTRLQWEAVGGGVASYEGAWSGDELELTLGVGLADDGTLGDGRILAADAAASWGRFSLHGELVHWGDDFGVYDDDLIDPASLIQRADTTPYDVTASVMVVPEALEAAVRLEDLDDANDTRRLSVSLNWYQSGHDAKWMASWLKVRSDLEGLESDVFVFGLVLAF